MLNVTLFCDWTFDSPQNDIYVYIIEWNRPNVWTLQTLTIPSSCIFIYKIWLSLLRRFIQEKLKFLFVFFYFGRFICLCTQYAPGFISTTTGTHTRTRTHTFLHISLLFFLDKKKRLFSWYVCIRSDEESSVQHQGKWTKI